MSKTFNFQALHDAVLIQREEVSNTSKGGIALAISSSRKANYGRVLSVGPGRYSDQTGTFVATNVKVGDRVIFGENAGAPITLEDSDPKDNLVIMREVEIVGIVPPTVKAE